MRHTVQIMLGKQSEALLCDIKRYIIKYGSEEEKQYFNALLLADEEDSSTMYMAESAATDETTFISGIDNLFNISLQAFYRIPKQNRAEYLQGCFSDLYNKTITINNPGDSPELHICVFVPVYLKEYWKITQECLQAMEDVPQQFHVDLFLLPYDLAYLLESDQESIPVKMAKFQKETQETIKSILEAKKKNNSLSHLILIQNCNKEGLALDLNEDSFVRIVAEYALLSISHYNEIFNLSANDTNRPIHALGLSVLSFDRFYFVQYLLHRAYIHILDREKVTQGEVDVNKVSQIVQKVLSKNVNVFSSFYDEHVKKRLDKKMDQDTIITEIHPELQKEIDRLTDEFQSYITDPSLSLPEKKATLAQLLGEDDELLTGYMFNKKQLVIDDCSREVLDFFAQANNELYNLHEEIRKEDSPEEVIRKNRVNEIAENAVLSENTSTAQEMPSAILDELKRIKVSMREASNYIRLKSNELGDLTQQVEENVKSKKRLTDKGFVFDGHTFQLQRLIEERPCEEDYIPVENRNPKVDLRQYFTPVKNQGELGACSSFALVGIYEYILKKNKALDTDLSEAFVYHYAHLRENDHKDDGTSLYTNLQALSTEGVCQEKFYPYSDKPSHEEPTDEAKQDALTRLVKKALNVQKDIDHIKSALSQGYPVAVSIKVYDSFEPQYGFIPRPREDEIASEKCGNHAMVLCGYSDEEKFFIARNSWGTSFGEKGYCYLPYSYVEDFMNVACIITEISMANMRVAGNDSKTTLSFDMSNSKIKSAILRNLIEEEKHSIKDLNKDLQCYEVLYNQVFQTLGNNATRTTLCDGTIQRLEYEKEVLQKEKEKLEPERIEALNKFDEFTGWIRHWFACSVLLVVAVYTIILVCGVDPYSVFFNWGSYITYGIYAIETILFILTLRKRHNDRIDLDEDYKSRIEGKAREILHRDQELAIMKLKSHVAGMIIDSLSKLFRNLHSKYNGMHSYVGNLQVWREEEERDSQMSDLVREPFLSLVSNPCLDKYFEECKDKITSKIKLFEMFRHSYHVEESEIIRFKNDLKKSLVDELFGKLKGFSIFEHIVGTSKYPYAERKEMDLNNLLQTLDQKSSHFARTISTGDIKAAQNASCKLLFVHTDFENERVRWNEICRQNFQNAPSLCHADSQYKITLLQMNGLALNEIAILK